MTAANSDWDAVLRPRLTPYVAYAVAFVIAAAGIVVGVLLKIRYTGAIIQTADQVAMGGIGVILAGAILLLATPRVRVGPAGIGVRNVLVERVVPWSDVVDVSFPEGARWARVDLADYEYVPLFAVQSVDGERAVESMETLRAMLATYRPGPTES
ncbi:PH domain-containing protein [Mycobacterium sp. CVI_P3]|uniref:PH domain-containing protein n=1 Tax=Mycobacterium pinniadriaticum TaxID=2994102 RepID=A0ABT3SAX3_9MYCO|nr:PH domain-containing protein [Mycobacterium pinniadriaticum]MCX2930270.1 PH domain-containing protein [Mycobacterium pinniadriaticum]MCX2936668.1 PH domain-containing protein [Mycobacterium pinniadriaticum]